MTPVRRFPPLALWLIAGAMFATIEALGLIVSGNPSLTNAETNAVVAVNGFHAPALDAIAQFIDVVFGPRFAVLVAVLAVVIAGMVGRSWWTALRMALLIAIPWAAADVIKVIIQRPRLDMSLLAHPILVEPTSFSYPSGHTAFATALGMSTVVMLAGWRYRAAAIVVAAVVALTTAWSRMYLGAHYPSDVLGSLLLVSVWCLCLGALMRNSRLLHPQRREEVAALTRVVDSGMTKGDS
ncbi:phosphatase PAP2 family protein [Microbacterium sp. kSW2-24]|uniref:phosphatase PAP2 family protein n=1 Tax=Microbacterium galbinum TaxID=2851646 RepID=UPI001FFC7D28|nr:phosphatase PAP2 family protein [Microbacterium galbinum]MCK2021576.1 phosphatase PAP2 family protein [Microbacterium galbinum]